MGSNRRKEYDENQQRELDGKPCEICGCRHFYMSRAFAGRFAVIVTRTCRNCGQEREFKIGIRFSRTADLSTEL